ncbi:hypothetical protein [Methylobacterium sp. Leaf100]|uniref:hypothetical protein n=1 Tax=Methylobacterium sp. Leaf100 TaxID=1736252 RepID=UPI0006FC0AC1|nr:hypothetical protein [Methylobacterium sp. Leaf100]KQP36840.1 hypothetical protein ASF25_02565 [Methylobacterium sp. Leaf100]
MADDHDDTSQDAAKDTRKAPEGKPANAAPDAVMDPNEKTDGKPGAGPQGGGTPDDETDPGGG